MKNNSKTLSRLEMSKLLRNEMVFVLGGYGGAGGRTDNNYDEGKNKASNPNR